MDGCFDPLHDGHIQYFAAAKELTNLPVVCSITNDDYLKKNKHRPLLNQNERGIIIANLRSIDFVYINNSTTAEMLDYFKPQYYFKGKDWENKIPFKQIEICKKNKTIIIFNHSKNVNSSTKILKRYLGGKF